VDKSFLKTLRKRFALPLIPRLEKIFFSFRPTEKLIFGILAIILLASSLTLFSNTNRLFSAEIPKNGGEITEGIIGFPRFINPLFAISDADRDLTTIVYSGLLSYDPEKGLVPNLAESYQISDDSLSYTFKLRPDIFFHDGEPITTDDIEFTILKAQDINLKSPKRPNWEGVQIEKLNQTEIKLTLSQPYAPFLENATLGILPKHLWKNIDSDQFTFTSLNIEPIGSGPFLITNIKRASSGLPEIYEFAPFKKYALGKPYLSKLTLRFYTSPEKALEALKKHEIENLGTITSTDALDLEKQGFRIEKTSLPRVFGIFFNQNQAEVFSYPEVRQALKDATDTETIIQDVLSGYASRLTGPIPTGFLGLTQIENDEEKLSHFDDSRISFATSTLEKKGWKKNESGIYEKKLSKTTQVLEFSISTANTAELKQVAEILKSQWEKIGAKVEIKVFEIGDLNQNIIRPRKYNALLFGEVVGRDLDLFAFWHSSQRNDPGLNIALYTNIKADKLLSDGRKTSDQNERIEKYLAFEEIINEEIPAIFLYSPDFIYSVNKNLKGFALSTINTPAERFAGINNWHLEVQSVWKIFTQN